jgi:hypothetical protein
MELGQYVARGVSIEVATCFNEMVKFIGQIYLMNLFV